MPKLDDDELKRRKRASDVAADGEQVTVRMMAMDSMLRLADKAVLDVARPIQPLMHRPGFVQLSDAEKANRERLYRDHDNNLAGRWKSPTQQSNHSDVVQPTGDAKLNAYVNYERRVANAWRYR